MQIITPLENIIVDKNKKVIFLAGPTYRISENIKNHWHKSWRKEVVDLIESDSVFKNTILVIPEYIIEPPIDWNYSRQVSWERKWLDLADIILFWIPRSEELPAYTTNIEVGQYLLSNKVVIGGNDDPRNNYIKEVLSQKGDIWHTIIANCIDSIKFKLTESYKSKIWFTSDTHFEEDRTNILSKRPYHNSIEMSWDLVKKWNTNISKNDIVYHLGDIGNADYLNYLNFKKLYVLRGNYDNSFKDDNYNITILNSSTDSNILVFNLKTLTHEYVTYSNINKNHIQLVHEPSNVKDTTSFYLYGHIHGLQKVKVNGLNVGVDCHNFKPIELNTVLWYKNAIENHYDEEVFINNDQINRLR